MISGRYIYGFPLLYGFMGYVGGIGLMLWGAAALKLTERRPSWLRWLVVALAGLLCLMGHAIAFLLFTAVVAGVAAGELLDRHRAPRERLLAAAVPVSGLLPAVVFFVLASPTASLPGG